MRSDTAKTTRERIRAWERAVAESWRVLETYGPGVTVDAAREYEEKRAAETEV